jgi:uncharacterized protein (TIGR02266 family)
MGTVQLVLRYGTEEELWYAYVRSIAEDGFFVSGRPGGRPGDDAVISFEISGRPAMQCRARYSKRLAPTGKEGSFLTLDPSAAFNAFITRKQSALKEGRPLGTLGGKRAHVRYGTCLEVEFRNYPDLSIEYASNISKGGLFVRTDTPPALNSKVSLAIKLPNGEMVETQAHVAHVVTPQEARARGSAPGAGLEFGSADDRFHGPIDRLIDEYQARPPRVLVADPNPLIAAALSSGLGASGVHVDTAGDGARAMSALLEGLFQYDLLLADPDLPGLDGRSLVDRIRRVGGEKDLRIVLWVEGNPAAYADIKGPGLANDILQKRPPSEELLKTLLALLGR